MSRKAAYSLSKQFIAGSRPPTSPLHQTWRSRSGFPVPGRVPDPRADASTPTLTAGIKAPPAAVTRGDGAVSASIDVQQI